MTNKVVILGYPLGHSLSPIFQQAGFDFLGLDIAYESWETHPNDIEQVLEKLKSSEYLGASVTIPFKEQVCSYLQLSEEVKQIGAVNTIVNRKGELWGYNTDTYGFLKGLTDYGFELEGKSVLIIGAGGAARAVAISLSLNGIESLIIANRTFTRAQDLIDIVSPKINYCKAISITPSELESNLVDINLVVNCTSMGMKYSSQEHATPLTSKSIPKDLLLYDLVYNPIETPLIKEAKESGAATIEGLPMLIYQGTKAFELWTQREAPFEVMYKAALEILLQ